jgi:membrane protease YdiL (CAAX protease family)
MLVGQSQHLPTAPITTWKLAALAGVVAPILEESFFRGCLLPLMARTSGSPGAVILTALLFAFFHHPPTIVHCVCFAISGIFYGWARVASGSTTTPALMHAAYNLTLLACQKL